MENQITTAIEFAKNNPDSAYATELRRRIESGSLNNELQSAGLTQFIPKGSVKEPNILQNIATDITQPFESVGGSFKAGVEALGSYLGNKKEYNEAGMNLKDVYKAELEKNNQDNTLTNVISEGATQAPARDITTGQGVEQLAGDLGKGLLNVSTLEAGRAVTPVKSTIGALAKKGAKYGAGYGVTTAMQEGGNVEDVLTSGLEGGTTGAVLGAGLGVASKGISKGVNLASDLANKTKNIITNKITPNPETFVQDLVSPKLTNEIKAQALQEGRVTKAGVLSKAKVNPSKKDISLAEAVSPYIKLDADITANISNVNKGISGINEGVKAYVKANKVPFNTNQLKSQLNKGKDELKLVFASDSNAKKTYDALVKEFMKHVENKDTFGLLQGRQTFDKLPAVKKLLDSQGLGENVKKEVSLTVRRMANEYIAKLLPKGNPYKASLLQETKMIEALGNMADKNTGLIGKNKLQLLTEQYPILKLGAAGLVGAGGVGVGGAIIGSSD